MKKLRAVSPEYLLGVEWWLPVHVVLRPSSGRGHQGCALVGNPHKADSLGMGWD